MREDPAMIFSSKIEMKIAMSRKGGKYERGERVGRRHKKEKRSVLNETKEERAKTDNFRKPHHGKGEISFSQGPS